MPSRPRIPTISLEDQVVIITGAGRGLGREYAWEAARRGAKVVVNDIGVDTDGGARDDSVATTTVTELTQAGHTAVADTHSVTTEEGGAAIVESAIHHFGRVDALINNAGILRDDPMLDLSLNDVSHVLDVHLKGAFNVTAPVFKQMANQGYGRVVFTSSPSGLLGNPTQTAYAAAKMGVIGLTRSLANEGREHGIKVNAIAPGAQTRMTVGLPSPLDRIGPETVAPAAVYLASNSCVVNGDIWVVAGGRIARAFLGLTPGLLWNPLVHDLSAEEVREGVSRIQSLEGFSVPGSMDELLEEAVERLASEGS